MGSQTQEVYDHAVAVTPHDSNALTRETRAVWVGGAGNITCRMRSAGQATPSDVVFTGVPAGTLLPIRVTHVRATGTTATNMVALW